MYGPGDLGPGHMVVVQGGHDWMLPFWLGTLMPFAVLFILWALVWKGLALWHSARRGQYWWFLALLIVNTFGILEIIYLFLQFAPESWWLWMGLVMLFFTMLLSNLAPVLIFPLFYKYKPLEDEELVNRLTRLAESAGTP